MQLVTSSGETINLRAEYDKELHVFSLSADSYDDSIAYLPVLDFRPDELRSYDKKNYEIYLLYNKREDYGENSIFQVRAKDRADKDNRIGWIFPIQALESCEHEYAKNIYFLKYAFIAIQKLLEYSQKCIDEIECRDVMLSDLYTMEETVLLIDKENAAELADFHINDYVVSLYSYGYSFCGNGNLFQSCNTPGDSSLHIKPISMDLKHIPYFSPLYREQIPIAEENISRFHLFYQIIEILIAEIFNLEFREIVDTIHTAGIEIDLFEKREDLVALENERNRVKKLFHRYTRIPVDDSRVLLTACNKLLQLHGKLPRDDAGEGLYDIRCLLVHRCYVLSNDEYRLLSGINDVLSSIVSQMVMSFKKNMDVT